MRTIKVIISYILITALLLITVGAAGETPAESTGYTPEEKELVEKLLCLGVIEETDKNLYEAVTRAEMAKIVVDYMNVSDYDLGGSNAPFSDVTPELDGGKEIALLYNLGYVSGSGDNLYHPLRAVSLDEATVFIVNAMGYGFMAKASGGYPEGYRKVASKYHLYTGIKSSANLSCLDVYRLIENSLDTPAVVLDGASKEGADYTVDKNHTVLNEFYGIYEKTGIMTGDEYTTLMTCDTDLSKNQVEIDGVTHNTEYDCGEYLGSCVNYYYRDEKGAGNGYDTVIYVERNSVRNKQTVVEADSVVKEKTTNQRVYYRDEDNDLRNVNIKTNVSVIFNGKCYLGYGMLKNVIPAYGILKFIDNNNDSEVDVINITSYENIVVKSIDTISGEIVNRLDNSVLKINQDRDSFIIINDSDGKEAKLSDIQLWDVLTVSASKNPTGSKKIVIRIVRDTVKGRVEALGEDNGKTIIEINGNEYSYVPGCEEALKLGNKGTFYLDYRGNIVLFRSGEDDGVNYAIFYQSANVTGNLTEYELLNESGEWVIYPIKKKVKVDGKSYDLGKSDERSYVINLLSKGELFRYALSVDGEISMIDTKNGDNTAGSLKEIYSGNKLGYRDGILFNSDDGFHFAATTDTVIFSIPEDITDKDAYRVVTRGAFRTETTYTWPYKVYNINESDINVATAMIATGLSGSALNDATTFSVIKEIRYRADSDGEFRVNLIFANGNSGEDGLLVADEVRNSATDTMHSIEEFNLQPNDIIQYGQDNNGMIDDIFLVYRYDTQGGTLTPGELDPETGYVDNRFNADKKIVDANGRHVYATVETVENGFIKFVTTEFAEPQLCNILSTTVVYKVSRNNDAGEPIMSSVNSLKKGDKIVCRLQSLNAREIFIIE